MQRWFCVQFSLIHAPSLGDLVVLCPTQTVSHTQKCQGANSCCCAAASYGCIINAKVEKIHLSHVQAHSKHSFYFATKWNGLVSTGGSSLHLLKHCAIFCTTEYIVFNNCKIFVVLYLGIFCSCYFVGISASPHSTHFRHPRSSH